MISKAQTCISAEEITLIGSIISIAYRPGISDIAIS